MGADTDSRNGDEHKEGNSPTDEEQVETEWHFWLLAIVATGGVGLLLFPPDILPGMGYILIALAVVGWLSKTIIERDM